MKFTKPLCIAYSENNQKLPQILAIIAACISSIATGTLYSWTSPSISILTSNASHLVPITLEAASYFTVISPMGMILLTPPVSVLSAKFGRQKIVMLISVPYIIAWLLVILGINIEMLYLSRFIEGIGEAIFFSVVPVYVSEIAEPNIRGQWGNFASIGVFMGVFLINTIGNFFDIRTAACILIVIPVIHLLVSICLPESPYFLIAAGKIEEARYSLRILRWRQNVEDELKVLIKDVNRQTIESGTWKDLFIIPTNLRALLISIGMRTAQQFSGFTAFLYYTQFIFNQVDGNLSAITSAIIFSGSFTVFLFIFSFIVEKLGRRISMTLSCFGCCIATTIETIYFYIDDKSKLDTSHFSWIPISGMILYVIAFSSGLGTLPTLMLGELFSSSVKSKAVCITNMFYFVELLICSKLFQTLSVNYGMFASFCFFSLCSFIGVIFSYLCVPETKGKTLEEIQQGVIEK